jgi:hypothetical protein
MIKHLFSFCLVVVFGSVRHFGSFERYSRH